MNTDPRRTEGAASNRRRSSGRGALCSGVPVRPAGTGRRLCVPDAQRFGRVAGPLTADNIRRLTESVYTDVIITSVGLALLATVIALAIGYPAAYAISRLSPRWRTVALIAVVLPFWTNFLIRTYAWIVLLNNEGLINKALRSAGLIDNPLR
jgi:spermidine/putrescine transport system permease protein